MGEGIANEILNQEKGGDVINYPSGFGNSIFSGAEDGGGQGGGFSEADMLEAAIAASLCDMNIDSNTN